MTPRFVGLLVLLLLLIAILAVVHPRASAAPPPMIVVIVHGPAVWCGDHWSLGCYFPPNEFHVSEEAPRWVWDHLYGHWLDYRDNGWVDGSICGPQPDRFTRHVWVELCAGAPR